MTATLDAPARRGTGLASSVGGGVVAGVSFAAMTVASYAWAALVPDLGWAGRLLAVLSDLLG